MSEFPDWAEGLLRCPKCGTDLPPEAFEVGAAVCPSCGHRLDFVEGVAEALIGAHQAVENERRAVEALDAGEISLGDPVGSEAAQAAVLRHIGTSRTQLIEVLARRPLEDGAVVVELGADACWASELFLDRGARVIAVDISDHLRMAERADDPHLLRMRADMNALPLRDGSVDVVWATAAAHHSWDLQRTFDEAARVLRPGGRISFCCEPMPSALRYPFGLGVGDEERQLGINETWVSRSAWLAKARRAGFRAEIELPALDTDTLVERLGRKGIPASLGRRLLPVLRPVLPLLQVSVHLHGHLSQPANIG